MILVTHDFDDVVRLATHVLVLERGAGRRHGPLVGADEPPRPPVAPRRRRARQRLRRRGDADADRERGLVELAFEGGTLLAVGSRPDALAPSVRVRIPAREVILATRQPDGLSLHNVAAPARCRRSNGTRAPVGHRPDSRRICSLLLAEVTRDAIERLEIAVGSRIYALVKSVSIGVIGVAETRQEG